MFTKSAWRSLPPRSRALVRSVLVLDIVLVGAAGVAGELNGQLHNASGLDPIHAYLTGHIAFTFSSFLYFGITFCLMATAILVAAHLYTVAEAGQIDGDVSRGNWWLLAIIPAIFGNYFDAFAGHWLFIIIFIGLAACFYTGRASAWKWGAALGIFITVFYATDGVGDFIRGGPWNVRGLTLSSVSVTHTLWGILAWVSDFMVLWSLVPLVYSLLRVKRRLLISLWGAALFLAIVPRLALLPVAGFVVVFSGWAANVAMGAWGFVFIAVAIIIRSKGVPKVFPTP